MLGHRHSHQKKDPHEHVHTHGVLDPFIFTSERGVWAIKWSFFVLLATAIFQAVIVSFSGSVALLVDTIHNIGDATTAIPLWIAFKFARLRPSKRFTYGYGRLEDLAGVMIVLIILLSAIVAGYESLNRLFHPHVISHLGTVMAASVIGFLGNEAVARLRIRVGGEIGSAALTADGHHARVDGLTSLSVLFGAVGAWLGYPLMDPIIGLLITAVIIRIVWESGKAVFTRLLDGIDPEVIDEIERVVNRVAGVMEITDVQVRWLGHRLHTELNIAVTPSLSVEKGHEIAKEVHHQLLHHVPYLFSATVHVDPANASGKRHHRAVEHVHDNLPAHSH